MQNFLNTGETIDFFEIQVNKFQNIDSKTKIKKLLPQHLQISDWRQLNPSLFNALEVEKKCNVFNFTINYCCCCFNLISSMIILVSMKNKDIGVLRMLGVKKIKFLKYLF